MKPTSKTPYEIRLELLQLAFNILSAKHMASAAADHPHMEIPYPQTSPTTEDVIKEAEKMNSFISKANQAI
jgi:hypothetical protein